MLLAPAARSAMRLSVSSAASPPPAHAQKKKDDQLARRPALRAFHGAAVGPKARPWSPPAGRGKTTTRPVAIAPEQKKSLPDPRVPNSTPASATGRAKADLEPHAGDRRRRGRDTNRPASSSAARITPPLKPALASTALSLIRQAHPRPLFPGPSWPGGAADQGGGFASAADARYTAIPCVRSAARCT